MATVKTITFNEDSNGWSSFWDYEPTFIFSLRGKFYSTYNGKLWEHYNASSSRGSFYDTVHSSNVTLILNEDPSAIKNFQTINYEGSNGWQVDVISTDEYQPTTFTNNSISDTASTISSYSEGKYIHRGVEYRSGFNRRENKYFANLKNNGVILRESQVLGGANMSGVKGTYLEVKLSTDNSTDVGGIKNLFSVASNYIISSY